MITTINHHNTIAHTAYLGVAMSKRRNGKDGTTRRCGAMNKTMTNSDKTAMKMMGALTTLRVFRVKPIKLFTFSGKYYILKLSKPNKGVVNITGGNNDRDDARNRATYARGSGQEARRCLQVYGQKMDRRWRTGRHSYWKPMESYGNCCCIVPGKQNQACQYQGKEYRQKIKPAFRSWQRTIDRFVAARARPASWKNGGHTPRDSLPIQPHTHSITTQAKQVNGNYTGYERAQERKIHMLQNPIMPQSSARGHSLWL